MPLVKMRMLPESGVDAKVLDILLNTEAIQLVAPFEDRAVLVVLGNGNIIRCEGTVEDFRMAVTSIGVK